MNLQDYREAFEHRLVRLGRRQIYSAIYLNELPRRIWGDNNIAVTLSFSFFSSFNPYGIHPKGWVFRVNAFQFDF